MTRKDAQSTRVYRNDTLNHVAFPMGGMGAGMISLEGSGAFSQVSLRHRPDAFNEPLMFAALHVKGAPTARVLEGPAPLRKAFGLPGSSGGSGRKNFGLPRFANASFEAHFPSGLVRLQDKTMPLAVELTGWSPFTPGDADASSLPVAGLEYRFVNRSTKPVQAVFSFHSRNFMPPDPQTPGTVAPMTGGFVLDVPETTAAPHVASWQMSRLFPRPAPVTEASCVRLADPLDWQPAPMHGYLANAHKRFSTQDGITYIGTRLRVAEAGNWIFCIGHDGGMRLFIDGQPVAAEGRREHPHRPGRTEVPVSLDKGDHEIMFAFDLAGGAAWGVSLSFKLPAGQTAGPDAVYPTPDAWAPVPATAGSFAAFTDEPATRTDCAWFRGGWFDALTMVWKAIAHGEAPSRAPHAEGAVSPGASLYVPFRLKAHESRTIRLMLAWYVPRSDLVLGGVTDGCGCGAGACGPSTYVPWYATRFAGLDAVATYWRDQYEALRRRTQTFTDCFYDTTLPAEVVEAVSANLAILKTPTVMRQHDGRLWGWEGCSDAGGCCAGSCTHVWNYAQALPHLFPELERSLRETEFNASQDARGHQNFRAALPIRPTSHEFHAAADGQLGGIMKVHREWRISGDTAWMQALWPKVRQSLDYCIATWDPDRTGTLVEPHHNTYDIEFWGADGMCTSFYLGALRAAIAMGKALQADVSDYESLAEKCRKAMETTLWNREYFFQRVQWKGLRAPDPSRAASINTHYAKEGLAILEKEGPKYQYGTGCLSDGVMGDWLARVSGLDTGLDPTKVKSHVGAIFRHNFKASLADHANPQRPGYAFGKEGGLLLCSWPKGGKPSLPFVYSDEVWTGIEYEVASHLIMMGHLKEGVQIVKTVRRRYDGQHRNPFDEYECGHWYARAMSSYSLLQALSGARYDAVEKTLHLKPAVKGDFQAFLCTATGFGTVGVKKGKPYVKVASGRIDINQIDREDRH
jgi:uncharacterized protein (DUF608 family)